jgi:TrmH RNA methyltransferase
MSGDDTGSPWDRARAKPKMDRKAREAAKAREGGASSPAARDERRERDAGSASDREAAGGRRDHTGPYARRESSPQQTPRRNPAEAGERGPRAPQGNRAQSPASRAHQGAREHAPQSPETVRRSNAEQRICGLNAALAAFAARPESLRKVYLSESRIGTLREILAFCVARRLGYRVVEDDELERISGSSHHEGAVLQMLPPRVLELEDLLAALPRTGAVRLLWLDGVGNPHNLGAVLRSAAHFGAHAVLLPPQSSLTLSPAAARVAEGGAEHVPIVHLSGSGVGAELAALERLADAGFVSLATLPSRAPSLYAQPLPARAVFVLGAEGEGMQKRLIDECALRISIPGSGKVESLNIANAVAVLLGEHWRQFPG